MSSKLLTKRDFGNNRQRQRRKSRRPELSEDQKVDIKDAFDLFDDNKSGTIDYHELKVTKKYINFVNPKKIRFLKHFCIIL